MEVLSKDDMDARISSVRPLMSTPSSALASSLWCIPCPWEPGTSISTEKAKRYAAELRALVAEAEYRILKNEYDHEVERNKAGMARLHERVSLFESELSAARRTAAKLAKKLRKPRRR